MIQIEHQRFKEFYSIVDAIDKSLDIFLKLKAATSDIRSINKGLKNIDNISALNDMNIAGASLLSTGYSELIGVYADDNTKAIFAGLDAMKSCAIGIATERSYTNCVKEAAKSLQKIGFAIVINVARVHDEEFQLADELLKRWVGCGRSTSCMTKKYLKTGDYYSHSAILKNLAGETSLFKNDPNIETALKHFYMFDKLITNFITDIENIFGDLNKFNNKDGIDYKVTPYVKISTIKIKEYDNDNADISLRVNIEDRGAGSNIRSIKLLIEGENDISLSSKDELNLKLQSRENKQLEFNEKIPSWSQLKETGIISLAVEIEYEDLDNEGNFLISKDVFELDVDNLLSQLDSSLGILPVWLVPDTIEAYEGEKVNFKAFYEVNATTHFEQIEGLNVVIKEGQMFEF